MVQWKKGLTNKQKKQRERRKEKRRTDVNITNDRTFKRMYKYADKGLCSDRKEEKCSFPSEDLYDIKVKHNTPGIWKLGDDIQEKKMELYKKYKSYRSFLLWKGEDCNCCDCRRRSVYTTKRLITTPGCIIVNREGLQFSYRDSKFDKLEKRWKTVIRTYFDDVKFKHLENKRDYEDYDCNCCYYDRDYGYCVGYC